LTDPFTFTFMTPSRSGCGYTVVLPTKRPCKIIAHGGRIYSSTFLGQVSFWLHFYAHRYLPMRSEDPIFTLDIPE